MSKRGEGGLERPIRPRCANEAGVNCRAVLSFYKFSISHAFFTQIHFENNCESSQTSLYEAKRPSGLVQQDYSRSWVWDAELGGRLCFNAVSDCGAGELLVRLLERMPITLIWFQISRLQPKLRKRHTIRS